MEVEADNEMSLGGNIVFPHFMVDKDINQIKTTYHNLQTHNFSYIIIVNTYQTERR